MSVYDNLCLTFQVFLVHVTLLDQWVGSLLLCGVPLVLMVHSSVWHTGIWRLAKEQRTVYILSPSQNEKACLWSHVTHWCRKAELYQKLLHVRSLWCQSLISMLYLLAHRLLPQLLTCQEVKASMVSSFVVLLKPRLLNY